MQIYGIIVAMEKEIALLRTKILSLKINEICNVKFYEGIFANHKIVFTTAGIGKVNAGITTILMIEHFKPKLIINTGIAGGYQDDLKPLDIIVASKVLYSDVDMTCDIAGGYKYGQLEGLNEYFKPSIEIIKDNNQDVKLGTILTGDQFVYNYIDANCLVKEKFSQYDVVAFDMESAAVAQVCTLNKVDYLIIRAISDIIGSTHIIDYNKFSTEASNVVISYVLDIIKSQFN